VSPIVGVLLLGYVCLIIDLVRRRTEYPWQRNSQIDGVVLAPLAGFLVLVRPFLADGSRPRPLVALDLVLFALLAVASLIGALAWAGVVRLPEGAKFYHRRWLNGLADLAETVKPLAPVRGGWRWSRPLRWCLLHPRAYLGLRRLGVRGWRGARLVGRWFTPAQVERLGWPARDLQMVVGGYTLLPDFGPYAGWDAERFIDTVHATDRPPADFTTDVSWGSLYRLGHDDAASEFLRYAKLRDPELGIDLALRYASGTWHIPYDAFPAIYRGLEHAGAQRREMTMFLDRLSGERDRAEEYQNGWAGLAAWIEHDGQAYVDALTSVNRHKWDPDPVCERWRSWHVVGERAPHLQPALWYAAGFTIAEALEMLDAGDPPEAEVLAGLAALRKSH
jgi:hypothetical protein